MNLYARDHPNLKEEVMTYRETRTQELGETVTVTVRQPEPEPELGSGLEAGKQTDRLCFTYRTVHFTLSAALLRDGAALGY